MPISNSHLGGGENSMQPEKSLNRQTVLDEDEYTIALSHIIARDFFPSLVHLDATNDYLDAIHTRDPNLIAASVRRLGQVSNTPLPGRRRRGNAGHPSQTPGQTPYASFTSDTPRTDYGDDSWSEMDREPTSKRLKYDTDMSLDEFQARYTSEDNSSFTQILNEENKQRKERYSWAWEAQRKVEKQRERMVEMRERMLIEPASSMPGVKEKFRIEAPAPKGLITSSEGKGNEGQSTTEKGKGKERETDEKALVRKATSVEEATQTVMAPQKDTRSAGVDGWKFKTRNSLMFTPDADVSPYNPPTTSTVDAKTVPRTISHGGTRLAEQDHSVNSSGLSEPPSPTRSRIAAAINGTPYRPSSPDLNDTNELVPNIPNPTAEQLGHNAVNQLMTWGMLNATPRVLSRPENEDPPPRTSTPFHVQEMSSREALSRRLANTAAKNLRTKAENMGLRTPGISRGKRTKGDMGPPSFTPKRAEAAGNLTPAARRLLERTTKRSVGSSAGTTQDRDLNRVRWTPTPASGK